MRKNKIYLNFFAVLFIIASIIKPIESNADWDSVSVHSQIFGFPCSAALILLEAWKIKKELHFLPAAVATIYACGLVGNAVLGAEPDLKKSPIYPYLENKLGATKAQALLLDLSSGASVEAVAKIYFNDPKDRSEFLGNEFLGGELANIDKNYLFSKGQPIKPSPNSEHNDKPIIQDGALAKPAT